MTSTTTNIAHNLEKDHHDRVFFAIELSPQVKDRVASLVSKIQQYNELMRVRWVEPENFHLTVRFFGSITNHQQEKILALTSDTIIKFEPFSFYLSNIALFPSPEEPRVIVLLPESRSSLVQLNMVLEQQALKVGLSADPRVFVPHLTIGRIKHGHNINFPATPILRTKINVDHITLFKSELTSNGPCYTMLDHIYFATSASLL